MFRVFRHNVAALALISPLVGCASAQLNYNTLDFASTTDSLLTRQILYNLANFIDNPVAVPAQMVISSGTAATSNSLSPTFSTPLGAGITAADTIARAATATTTNSITTQTASKTMGVTASDAWNQSWSYAPIADPDKLKRLQALYRYAVDWSRSPEGSVVFLRNFPLVYKSASYNQPLCLQDLNAKGKRAPADASKNAEIDPKSEPKPADGNIKVCVTNITANSLAHGATTKTFTRQIPDEHYLMGPTCVACLTAKGMTINPLISGPWLHWQDLSGGPVRAERAVRPGDVPLGHASHFAFFADAAHSQKFVDFSVAVLSASTIAGSAAPSTGSSSSGGGGSSGIKTLSVYDTQGNLVTFGVPQ